MAPDRTQRKRKTQTKHIALLSLPYLVEAAQRRTTLTYEALGAPINWHPRNFGHPLRYIRDEICRPRGLPLLTAIVVRKHKKVDRRLPGKDFLPEGTDHLLPEEFRAQFEHHRDEAFAYTAWDNLLRELDLSPASAADPAT